MPDDNQSPTDTNTDANADVNANANANAGADLENNPELANLDLNIPDLNEIEYATPSAYIDPDIPTTPAEAENPDEPKEEQPEEETIELTPEQIAEAIKASNLVMAKVAEKIANSRNILIALSGDPSVDELSAAICLAEFLDRLGKHAIAIYSGVMPEALNFLNPKDKFENSADVLQDFVIALNKDKADHLRYKLEGDFVKVFITPYREKIVSDNLEFSYGDYNVDLVLALNVANGIDLDDALREYGKIMSDATVVNITTGNPGKFGEIEWNNKHASSVSEMIANLLTSASGDTKLDADEATALLTGIVAATDRFAKANTFPSTMQVASTLMDFGADQQLVAANISDDLDNQFFTFSEAAAKAKKDEMEAAMAGSEPMSFDFKPTEEPKEVEDDGTALQIAHGDEKQEDVASENSSDNADADSEGTDSEKNGKFNDEKPEGTSESGESKEAEEVEKPEEARDETAEKPEEPPMMDELKATEASLSGVGAETAPETKDQPVDLSNGIDAAVSAASKANAVNPAAATASNFAATPVASTSTTTPEMTIPTSGGFDNVNKYGQMLEDALNEPAGGESAPMESALPPVNPAASSAPEVSTAEVSGVPEINYGLNTSDQVLPPPPTPPVDVNSMMPMPSPADGNGAMPTSAPAPDAFNIPGV